MANNRINNYIGAIAVGAALVAVPGCTDSWDDHYNGNGSVTETSDKTLWEVISSREDLSKFAEIVRQAKYYKDNTHPVSTYSYADILAGGQVNTVWAPDNDALSGPEGEKWIKMLTDLTNGDVSVADGYSLQQQLVGNHIALWRHNISETKTDTVKMINGKNLTFHRDMQNPSLEGISIDKDNINIPTANGVLHVLKGIAPFHYNFYEYLKFREPRTKIGDYVVGKDTTYFFASGSIEGLPDENGNPTYVDSVYYTSNRLFESRQYLPADGAEKWQMAEHGFAARINVEDSAFVMLLPTDAAWDATYSMLEPAYKYASTYEDKSKGNLNTTPTPTIKMTDEEADSLKKMSIEMDMVKPLVFNVNKQPKRGGSEMWTLKTFDQFKNEPGNPDNPNEYWLNTYGDTLRSVKGVWDKGTLFNGRLVEMSNGLAYEVDSWNFPRQFYAPDVEVEVENSGIFYNTESNRYKMGPGSRRYSFSNEAFSDITDIYGKVSNGNFYHFDAPSATAGPRVDIILQGNSANAYVPNAQVMSGKYDIQIVVVPRWYIDIANAATIEDKFYVQKVDTIVNPEDVTDTTFVTTRTKEIDTTYVKSLADIYKYKLKATLSYNNNAAKDKTQASKNIEYDGLRVDTLTVIEDFEFPYSYKNMRFTYPTLYVEGVTGKNDAKNGFVFDLVIDKIILKRKN